VEGLHCTGIITGAAAIVYPTYSDPSDHGGMSIIHVTVLLRSNGQQLRACDLHLKQKEEKDKKPTGLHLLFLFTVLIKSKVRHWILFRHYHHDRDRRIAYTKQLVLVADVNQYWSGGKKLVLLLRRTGTTGIGSDAG